MVLKRILFGGLIFSIIIGIFFSGGCGKSPEKKPSQNEQKQETSQKPKEPKELKDITKEIEGIIAESEKKKEAKESPGQAQEQNKQGQESSNSQSGAGEEKKQSQEQSQDQGEQKKQENQQGTAQDWSKEEKAVRSIHEKWNALETSAVKAGASDSLIAEFETNLDHLTNQVMEKNITETPKSANELYGSAIKIADLYETDNPPPADMLKYFTQKSLMDIEEKKWAEAQSNAGDLKRQWEKVKTMMGQGGATLNTQMDYAITDFLQAIEKENKDVATIKGEVLLLNIEKITEELKKNKER